MRLNLAGPLSEQEKLAVHIAVAKVWARRMIKPSDKRIAQEVEACRLDALRAHGGHNA